MTELHETPPAVGETITVMNEHLVPFGSRSGTMVKRRTGWFSGHIATVPVLGYPLGELGDGGVETLAEFKMRARATVLSRMQWEGVAGWEPVRRALDAMGLLDVEQFQPGMTAAWPYDLRDSGFPPHALMWNTHRSEYQWAKAMAADAGGNVSLVVRVAPVNDEEPWTPEVGTWPEWVAFKRLLWEHGERQATNNGWCGTFQNVMSSLGIDANLANAVGVATPVAEEVW